MARSGAAASKRSCGRLGRGGGARVAAFAVALLAATLLAGGCAGSASKPTAAALKLEREDLVAAARELRTLQAPVAREVAATKAAWPLIANGLPRDVGPVLRAPATAAAAASAARLRLPVLFGEAQAATLTGAATGVVGLFRAYALLSARGWRLLLASLERIESGAPAVSSFARANAPLYIESIYDAHFTLAQIGKKLTGAYKRLGGATAFGATLTPMEVASLARSYSEASDRLHPHVGVRLGS